jgi:hypothetical protein
MMDRLALTLSIAINSSVDEFQLNQRVKYLEEKLLQDAKACLQTVEKVSFTLSKT